jgi:hypothetical protein
MCLSGYFRTRLLLCALLFNPQSFLNLSQSKSYASQSVTQQTSKERDGQHDFDFEIGTWNSSEAFG